MGWCSNTFFFRSLFLRSYQLGKAWVRDPMTIALAHHLSNLRVENYSTVSAWPACIALPRIAWPACLASERA